MSTRHREGQGFEGLEARLDGMGDDLRQTLERAALLQGEVVGEDRVLAFEPPPAPTLVEGAAAPRAPARVLALAAAALVLASLGVFFSRGDRANEGQASGLRLGASTPQVALVAPRGTGASFAAFDWTGAWPAGWQARVHVMDAAGTELFVSEPLASAPWIPRGATRDGWPGAIRWELVLVDASGAERGRFGAQASRADAPPR